MKGYIKSKNGNPIEIVDAKAREDVTSLKDDLSQLSESITEITSDSPYYSIADITPVAGKYVKRTDGSLVSNSSFKYVEIYKNIYNYRVSGNYVKNSNVTLVIYVDEHGNKVGEDDLPDSSINALGDYDVIFPTNAVKAYVSYNSSNIVIYKYTNGLTDIKSLIGTIVKPIASEHVVKSASGLYYSNIYVSANRRYIIMSDMENITTLGTVITVWDIKSKTNVCEGVTAGNGRVCVDVSGESDGYLYLFDTTGDDELHEFLLDVKLGFLNTPYKSLIMNKSQSIDWYGDKEPIYTKEFSGTTASVYYSDFYTLANHRYVFIVDGEGISTIGLVSSAWVERSNSNVASFTPSQSYRFCVAYNTNGHGTIFAFDTTNDDGLHKYLLATGVNFRQKIADSITSDKTDINAMKLSKYYGKNIVAFGDSITNQESWYGGVSAYFGSRPINRGVGGSTVTSIGSNAFCSDARINTIPESTDLILIMGGVNDWAQNASIGEKSITNTDTSTIYGAVNTIVDKLHERVPNAMIVCMGCTFGMKGTQDGHASRNGVYNNNGLTTLDYGRAVADAFAINGIESFVIGEHCGWNTTNIDVYVNWDGSYFHPNSVGGARMAEVICRFVD